MTGEDRLRSQLRSAAASMPVGTGSLAGVQARAAQLQRRRNAVRGGAGAFALIVVAAIGIVSLRDAEVAEEESAFSATDVDVAAEAEQVATAAMAAGDTEHDEMAEEMSDESDFGSVVETSMSDEDLGADSVEAAEEFADDEIAADERLDSAEEALDDDGQAELPSSSGSGRGDAVFATTVSVVTPPDEAEGDSMHYLFSGGHAVAKADDGWYAYDGTDWQSLGVPSALEVVAVDLSRTERIAILGVVRPQDCVVEHVVGVRSGDEWGFTRIDDGTPATVNSELMDARVLVTDMSVEVERTERLQLFTECADLGEPTEDGTSLVHELAELGEIERTSWLSAPLEPDNDARWTTLPTGDASAAALRSSDLEWVPIRSPRLTAAARPLTPARDPGRSTPVALHETVVFDVATTVEVSDGMAWLRRGDQAWEVCPIAEHEVVEARGKIGWAGDHLAVVVGKPEQTLFLVERTE